VKNADSTQIHIRGKD